MDRFDEHRYADMVRLFVTDRIPEGLLVKGMLESAGSPYRMGPVDLWVPREEEEEARELIREARRSAIPAEFVETGDAEAGNGSGAL